MKIQTEIKKQGRIYIALIHIDEETSDSCYVRYYLPLSQLVIESWEHFLPKVSKEISSQLGKIFTDMGFEELTLEKDGECSFLVDDIKLTFEEFEEVVEQIINIIKEVVK